MLRQFCIYLLRESREDTCLETHYKVFLFYLPICSRLTVVPVVPPMFQYPR